MKHKRGCCQVTPSHQVLFEDWFLRRKPSDCEVAPHFVEPSDGVSGQGNWHRVVAHKFEALERAFRDEPENQLFVMSDADVRFYRPFVDDIVNRMHGMDGLFQRNRPGTGDQNACITVLSERKGYLGYGFLPTSYWSPGSKLGRWQPGLRLSPA